MARQLKVIRWLAIGLSGTAAPTRLGLQVLRGAHMGREHKVGTGKAGKGISAVRGFGAEEDKSPPYFCESGCCNSLAALEVGSR